MLLAMLRHALPDTDGMRNAEQLERLADRLKWLQQSA